MSNIIFAPATQTEKVIGSLLNRKTTSELDVDVFEVADFKGVWLKLTQNQKLAYPHGEVASPVITQKLKLLGVGVGDYVLVARDTSTASNMKVRMVSPITSENWHLAGRSFRAIKPKQQLLLIA